jgi:hypothetical protein
MARFLDASSKIRTKQLLSENCGASLQALQRWPQRWPPPPR